MDFEKVIKEQQKSINLQAKLLKEQDARLVSLLKRFSMLQQKHNILVKKVNRTYHSGRGNSSDIDSIKGILNKK